MFLLAPLGFGVAVALLTNVPMLSELLGPGQQALTSWTFYRDVLFVSFTLFFGGLLLGLVFIFTIPRLLHLALTPDKVYPLYGFHYAVQRQIARLTNSKFYNTLFGDSSYIVHYLSALGYDLSVVKQTGTNFGVEVKHETPYLVFVDSGTMVSDGLSIMNADFSSTSFRVSRVSLGSNSFFGNNIAYPAGGRTGDDCLLATKVMVPIDGHVREGVGLLGSPCFEIPRSVERDRRFDDLKDGEEFRWRLATKNKHNIVTIGIFLMVRWFHFFVISVLALAAVDLYHSLGASAIVLFTIITLVFSIAYFVLVERAATAFRDLSPQYCSIYEPYFWWHERYWKHLMPEVVNVFNGTPLKGAIWRLLGVRIGRRVYDEGCDIVEKTLVAVGDDCMLNAGTAIQAHSLEDGTFKSDRIEIGAGCTIGISAFVHYGVTIGDGALLDAGSFLMKGEEVAPHACWQGNPASEIGGRPPVNPAATTTATVVAMMPPPACRSRDVDDAAPARRRYG
jgi:non-ribosomal peptide synthetase-like protein